MPDYQRGKIYKIVSGDLVYIGSTCEPTLAKRLANHVSDYKLWKANKRGFVSSFPLIESGDYTMCLIELHACGSRDELRARERFWIESMTCVNRSIPGRTQKEWEEAHKDHIRERDKSHYEANKEQICDQKRAYYQANKERIKARNLTLNASERQKAWQEANKDKTEEWYEANKKHLAEYKKEYRKKKREGVP